MKKFILDYDKKKNCGIIITEHLDLVRELMSVADETASMRRRIHRYAFIPDRKYAITPTGRFELGLYKDICTKLINEVQAKIVLTEALKERIHPTLDFADIWTCDKGLRDYQLETVQALLKSGRGIAMVATAGGKTLIMSTLINTIIKHKPDAKCVLITPTQLVNQTYKEFLDYGAKTSMTTWTGDSTPDKQSSIIIAGSNILLSKKQDYKWLLDADVLLIDETHKLRHGNTLNKVIKKFKTNNRFGFTGTIPDYLLDQWAIKGLIGPVVYEKSSSELREEKYISQVEAKIIKISYTETPEYTSSPKNFTDNYQIELDYIISNNYRNNVIKKVADKCSNNVLILVDRIAHCDTLYETLKQNSSKQVFLIKGEVETQDREKVKSIMEHNDNVICIAISNIFSTGINIKNIHYIMFVAGGKAKIKTIQSIGRGLRLHNNKSKLVLIDIVDDLKYGMSHFLKRQRIYENEKIPYEIKEIREKSN